MNDTTEEYPNEPLDIVDEVLDQSPVAAFPDCTFAPSHPAVLAAPVISPDAVSPNHLPTTATDTAARDSKPSAGMLSLRPSDPNSPPSAAPKPEIRASHQITTTPSSIGDGGADNLQTGQELKDRQCAIVPYGIKDHSSSYPEAVGLYFEAIDDFLATNPLATRGVKTPHAQEFLRSLRSNPRFAQREEPLTFWYKEEGASIRENEFSKMKFTRFQISEEELQDDSGKMMENEEYRKLVKDVKERMRTQVRRLNKNSTETGTDRGLSNHDAITLNQAGVWQHTNFPMEKFESLAKSAKTELRMHNTYIDNLNGVGSERWSQILQHAADRGVRIQFLLCDPESPFALARTLGHRVAHPEIGDQVSLVSNGVKSNLHNLANLGIQNIEVRLFQPSTSCTLYQVDNTIFGGFLFIQKSGFAKPQFETRPDTELGRQFDAEFRALWDHKTTKKVDLDEWKGFLDANHKRNRSESFEEQSNSSKQPKIGSRASRIIFKTNPNLQTAVDGLANILVSRGLEADDEHLLYQLRRKMDDIVKEIETSSPQTPTDNC